ncbi:MAG: hypothetical protein ACLUMK_03690 [Christensenellales bacterium]
MAVSKKTARIIAVGLFALTLLFALAPTALAAVYWGQSGETVRRVQQSSNSGVIIRAQWTACSARAPTTR